MTKAKGPLTQMGEASGGAPPSRSKLIGLGVFVSIGFLGLVALGIWQVERLAWKTNLIAMVNERIQREATLTPGPAEWPSISARNDAYRHVSVRGVYLNDDETLVHALTDQGSGFWVMTPLRSDQGFLVLINRGFIPDNKQNTSARSHSLIAGETEVNGLLRVTEPKGQMFRANDPDHHRWFSRDVAQIATSRQLTNTAPYFIDADAKPNDGGLPVGGLTVVSFPNNHLVYAITWFSLAAMLVVFTIGALREPRRSKRAADTE